MKILHISDLHYKKNKTERKLDKFQKIIEVLQNEKIDLILFSGDLVDKKQINLEDGYRFLIDNFATPLASKIYLCCGNHDIDRNKITDMFKNHITSLDTEEKLSNFIFDNKNNEFENNISHINEYNELINNHYSTNDDNINELLNLHDVCINGKKISIVSLNFSWTAFDSEKDYGNLKFSNELLKKASNKINNSDLKIVLSHHPLDFLHSCCKKTISQTIFKQFDIIFNGHIHQEFNVSYNSNNTGILNCIAPSIMDTGSSNYPFGFSIIDINFDLYQAQIKNYEYNISHDKFTECNDETINIPVNEEKKEKIKISSFILNKSELIIAEANSKFINFLSSTINFINIFTSPILKTKSNSTEVSIKKENIHKAEEIDYISLLNDKNTILFGKDKCGKTVLLYKIAIDYLQKYTFYNMIPIYIDLKNYKEKNTIDVDSVIKNYYNFSNKDLNFIKDNYQIKLLLDNMDFNNQNLNKRIFDLLSSNKNISCIITSYEIGIKENITPNHLNFEKYYFHDLNKSKIREITNKWPIADNYNRNEIVEKIVNLFKQLNIHYNFWTVSLFLWIFEKTNNLNLHNNFELIDLYIENLLEKSSLVTSMKNQTFSYDNYKDFLSEIAFRLYSEHEDNCYCAKYSDIINYFENFKQNNIRIIAESKYVIDYILEKGILIKLSDELYTFRLNGVFEYFLSHYMLKNKFFLKEIIENSNNFLSFKNEIEIYAGYKRNDDNLLLQIYFNCIEAQKLMNSKLSEITDIDEETETNNETISELTAIADKLKNDITPLSIEDQDTLIDSIDENEIESKVKLKKKYNIIDINSEIYSLHIQILARVFRNSDDIKNLEILNEVFDFIIVQGCMSILYTLRELIHEVKNKEKNINNIKEIIDFTKSFTPIVAHAFLFDAIAHPNIQNIIKNKISILKKNPEKNQFILFVLYFLIIEIDPEANINLIDEMITISKSFNIQYSIYLKLLMYVLFKCHNNDELEKKLQFEIQYVYEKLFPNKKRYAKGTVNQIINNIKLKQ